MVGTQCGGRKKQQWEKRQIPQTRTVINSFICSSTSVLSKRDLGWSQLAGAQTLLDPSVENKNSQHPLQNAGQRIL